MKRIKIYLKRTLAFILIYIGLWWIAFAMMKAPDKKGYVYAFTAWDVHYHLWMFLLVLAAVSVAVVGVFFLFAWLFDND